VLTFVFYVAQRVLRESFHGSEINLSCKEFILIKSHAELCFLFSSEWKWVGGCVGGLKLQINLNSKVEDCQFAHRKCHMAASRNFSIHGSCCLLACFASSQYGSQPTFTFMNILSSQANKWPAKPTRIVSGQVLQYLCIKILCQTHKNHTHKREQLVTLN